MKTPDQRATWPMRLAATLVLVGLAACSPTSAPSLLASGKQHLAQREYKAAALQFKSALQLDPTITEGRYLLGMALLNSGDPGGAAIELSKALDQDTPAEKVVPALARALVLTGDYKRLTGTYGQLVLKDKDAQAALKSSVATAWSALGDRAQTEAAIKAALDARPEFGPALILRARVIAGQQDFAGALSIVEKVVAGDDDFHEAWLLKGEILELVSGDTAAAESAFRKSLAIEPAYMPAHLALITSRMRQKDVAGARVQLQAFRTATPQHPMVVFVDAQLALIERDFPKARESIQQLLRASSNHVGVLQLAGILEAVSGSQILAETHFSKALQLKPSADFARRALAQVNLRMGRPALALETLAPLIGIQSRDALALGAAGDAALRLGDALTAEGYFKRALALTPADERLRTVLALSNATRGDAGLALGELERIAAGSADSIADQALISARMRRREFDAALGALENLAKKKPKDPAIVHLRGRIYFAANRFKSARTEFEDTLKLDPSYFAATADLAALDVVEGKPAQAQARFDGAIKADPKNHVAMMALADLKLNANAPVDDIKNLLLNAASVAPTDPRPRLKLINLHLRKRQYKDAQTASQETAAAFPGESSVLDAVGRAQAEAGDVEQAISTFRSLAAADPKSSLAYTRLADVYTATGRRTQAETALRKALELDPGSISVQLALVDLLLAMDKRREALTTAKEFQTRQPGSRLGYVLEAALHDRLKDPAAAIAAYRSGLAKTNDSALAGLLFQYLSKQGRDAEAETFAVSWMKTHPGDGTIEYHLATTHLRRGQLPQAQERLERVVSQFPDNALARNNLAWVMVSRGQKGALVHARRAAEMAPSNASVQDTLALALAAEGQLDEALVVQRNAVALAPADNRLHLGLAKLAVRAGDKTTAREQLIRLQGLGTNFSEHAEVAMLLKAL